MTKQRLPRKLTNIPAPLLPGLYSVQAVSNVDGRPDVTAYRATVEAALMWKDTQATSGRFERFLLRHAADAWDVYSADGTLESLCDDVVGRRPGEKPVAVYVDRDLLDAEAAGCLGVGVTRVAMCEGHSASPAADHSNFGVTLHSMIRDAPPSDLAHIFVVESHTWSCRVSGIYADITKLSPASQDMFLDTFKAVASSQPIDAADHREILVNRLASLRGAYLSDVCAAVGERKGLDEEDIIGVRMNVGARGIEFRRSLARELIRLSGVCPTPSGGGAPEYLDSEKLVEVGDAVIAAAFGI